jgi:hypothetical protein
MTVTVESPGPHKQVVVHIGAGGITVDSKSAASTVATEVTFAFNGGGYGSYVARLTLSRITYMGLSVYNQREFRLAKGKYIITAVTRAWNGTGGDPNNVVIFNQPYLRAEVVGDAGSGTNAL